MPNMKLLDSQTGKYLELGKDWLYGGKDIIVNKCSIGYKIYEAIQHKDSEKFFMYDEDCPFTNELQEPLKTSCEENGAVMYGNRYILFEPGECDDYNSIFEEYSKQLRNEPNKFEELKEYMKHL